jgi:hypothetical protein
MKHGKFFYYYPTSQLEKEGEYRKDQTYGKWVRYYKDGKVKDIGYWDEDKPEGYWNQYYKDGRIKKEGRYTCGKPYGAWFDYTKPEGEQMTIHKQVERCRKYEWYKFRATYLITSQKNALTHFFQGAWVPEVYQYKDWMNLSGYVTFSMMQRKFGGKFPAISFGALGTWEPPKYYPFSFEVNAGIQMWDVFESVGPEVGAGVHWINDRYYRSLFDRVIFKVNFFLNDGLLIKQYSLGTQWKFY